MNRIRTFLRGLDWRVLFALPVLAALLGIANNLRVSPDSRVRWSGERPAIADEAEATAGNAESASPEERDETASKAGRNVERGVWTSNFVAATNEAETAHLPVVVIALLPGCPGCVRFHSALDNDEVKAWQKKLGWYFVMTDSSKNRAAFNFAKYTPIRNTIPPYIGVYWTRPDGRRTMRNFSPKRGKMGVPEESSLAQEWMHAIEASAPGAPGASFVAPQGLGVQINAKRLGSGQVKMVPETDLIKPGQKVVMTAKPNRGNEFAGWKYPDGRIVNGEPQLTLDDQCQAGVYTAMFRRRTGGKNVKKLKSDGEGK